VTDPRIDRRRFIGGAAMLGAAAAMGPAGIAALRSAGARSVGPPGGPPDPVHVVGLPYVHPPHPVLPSPRYRTVVETRHTPAGVPYQAALARPI
jgi:hypothetical protein